MLITLLPPTEVLFREGWWRRIMRKQVSFECEKKARISKAERLALWLGEILGNLEKSYILKIISIYNGRG